MDRIRLLYYQVQNSSILNNKTLNFILKSIIILGVGYALYDKIASEDELPQMLDNINTYLVFPNLYLLFFAFLLMPLMLWAESYRWLLLVKKIVPEESATLRKSVKAMLSGQTLGMFIPYRIGKIGGRIVVYATDKKWELVVITLFDGEGMKMLYDLAGLGGAVYILYRYFEIDYGTSVLIGIGVFLILLVRFYFFFNVKILIRWLTRFSQLERIVRKLKVIQEYDKIELYKVLQVSVFRMLLNFLQYYLLLRFFHVEVGLLKAFVLIGAIYFFVANLPLPALAGLFARIHIALFIWSQFSDNVISISSIPFLLWIFNSLIPALVGSIFVMNLNIAKNFRYER
jgi:hypothetical protein